MSQFQARLKELKERSGKTQARIAEDLGVTPQAFSYYVNGREPDYDTLIRIATYFGVSTDYLLGVSDTKYLENSLASMELGLSDEAIENLKKCKSDGCETDLFIKNSLFPSLITLFSSYIWLDELDLTKILEYAANITDNQEVKETVSESVGYLKSMPLTEMTLNGATACLRTIMTESRAAQQQNLNKMSPPKQGSSK